MCHSTGIILIPALGSCLILWARLMTLRTLGLDILIDPEGEKAFDNFIGCLTLSHLDSSSFLPLGLLETTVQVCMADALLDICSNSNDMSKSEIRAGTRFCMLRLVHCNSISLTEHHMELAPMCGKIHVLGKSHASIRYTILLVVRYVCFRTVRF